MTGDRRLVVRIDAEKCQGHARYHALAPELFELDEFGQRSRSRLRPCLVHSRRPGVDRQGQLSGTGDRDRRGEGLTSAH